jgi:hypothetical protein
MSKNEITQIENFTKSLIQNDYYSSSKDITGIANYFRSISKELKKIQYFDFIPKDPTLASQSRLKLAIELKALLNFYNYESYIVGINCLYLFLVLKKSKNAIGITSIFSLIFASAMTFYYFKMNYEKLFKTMDYIFKDEVFFLKDKLKRKEEGFTSNVSKFKLIYECINL